MPTDRAKFDLEFTSKADTTGIEKAIVTHNELRESLHLVALSAGDALGPFGELVHFLANPYILAFAGASLAVKELVQQHKEAQEIMLKNIEASRDLKEIFEQGHRQAILEVADAYAKLALQQRHLFDDVNLLTEGLNRNIATLKDQKNITDNVIGAQESLAQAITKAQEAAGVISHGTAQTQELLGAEAAQRRRDQADDAEKQAEINAKRNRASADQQEADVKKAEQLGKKADLERVTEELNDATALQASRERALGELKDAINRTEAEAKAGPSALQIGIPEGYPLQGDPQAYEKIKTGLQKHLDDAAKKATDAYEKMKAGVQDEEAKVKQYQGEKEEIAKTIQSLETLIESRQKEQRELELAASEMEEALKRFRASRVEIESDQARTTRTNEAAGTPGGKEEMRTPRGNLPQEFQRRADEANALFKMVTEGGHVLTADEANRILDMQDRIRALIAAWIASGHRVSGRMSQLEQEFEQLSANIANNRTTQ
jgi:hypothetical protein